MGRMGRWMAVGALAALPAHAGDDATTRRVTESIDARNARYAEVAHAIWGHAELGYLEEQST